MANTTLTTDIIAKEALAILDNELGWVGKMHRAHEEEFDKSMNGYKVGETISIRRPADFTVRTGAVMSTQDVVEGKVALTVDQQVGVDFEFTSTDLTLKIEDLSERVIKPAMSNIINHMANDVATQMYRGLPNWVGTPGQTVNSYSDFLKAPERLNEMAVPMDGRCSIMSPADHAGLLGHQTTLFVEKGQRDGAYRAGSLGELSGVDTYMSQLTPTHTVGALGGTPLVNGAAQNVTYDSIKNTWSQSLVIDGASTSITGWAKAGDVFTIAGVFMVNPKTKVTTGILQQFVVTADADSDGTGNVTLTISPGIVVSGPHQTVDAAPADNAALTFVGTAATSYKQNMAFHKNTMGLAVVPMVVPPGAVDVSRRTRNGISVRLIPVYDGTNDKSKFRLDLLYGRKMLDPRLGTRYSGTA